MNLFENLQSMNEDIKRAEELVDHNVLRDSGIEFYENGRGELIVKTIDDPIPLEVEVEQNDGKWFVTLPSEDIHAASNDLTDAIIKAVNQIDDMPPQMTPGCKSKLNEFTTEDKTESAILKDDKDIETIVEQKVVEDEVIDEEIETLTEDSADPKEALQNKAIKFGAMVDALSETISTSDLHSILQDLTVELDMDVYEDGEPYPTDLDGYFSEPVANLNLNDEADAELFDWVDNVLDDCINKIKVHINGQIETLKGEMSAIENDINTLESVIQ